MDDSKDIPDETISVKERRARFEKDNGTLKEENCDPHLASDIEARGSKESLTPGHLKKEWSKKKMSNEDAIDIRSKYGSLRVFKDPLCLVQNDETGALSICEDVMKEISAIEDTVNVIAIAGPYRTGKSYLMNRLAGVKGGFPLGNTTAATTKGLWVWCLEHPERKDEVLMLIDTEGIGDVKKGDEGNDNAILCLATLLSGTFVYNCIGVIDHHFLKTLSFVTKLSEMIITSNALPERDLDVGFFFPTFVLCLRDFILDISEHGTPDAYFEDSLAPDIKADKKKKKKYNEIRISILEHFQRRKCFVFDIPAVRETLRELEEASESDLSKDFRHDTEKFLQYMYICKPKELIDGSPINGRMFACLTEKYIVSLANGEMPCIDDALTIMAIQENEIAVSEAVNMCKEKIESLGFPLPDDFELKYKQIQRDALKQFRKKAVLDDKQVFQRIAEKEMDTFKIETIQENKTNIQNTCFQELQCMYNILIKPKVDDGTYFEQGGYKAYRDDFARLRENIKQRQPGADSYIVHMCGIEFENRYRKQDEEILEKANLSELEIKAEIQKQKKVIAQRKDELVQKEDLRKKSEAEKWRAYKDELTSERKKEQRDLKEKYAKALVEWEKGQNDLERKLKEKDDVISKLRKTKGGSGTLVAYKDELSSENKKEQEELKEKFDKELEDWKKGNKDLESKLKEKDEVISKLRKTKGSSGAPVFQKPAMKETVLKTFLSLIPVVGPIASGVYERFSSP